jgi:hypothetical protein
LLVELFESHDDARTCERHLLYETLSMIYLKQNQMCNPSQTFGLETNQLAAVGQYNTTYHSTNEEEIVISYTGFLEKSSRYNRPAILWLPLC